MNVWMLVGCMERGMNGVNNGWMDGRKKESIDGWMDGG